MARAPIVVNLGTYFAVFCPECASRERYESILEAETGRGSHVCPDAGRLVLGVEILEFCRA